MSRSADAWRTHLRATDDCVERDLPPSIGASYLIRRLAASAHERGTVIDAGCGDGSDTIALLRAGFTVLSVDIIPRDVVGRVLRELGPGAAWHFVQGDLAESIPADSGAAAAVLDVEVLPRVAGDGDLGEAEHYLREVSRVLADDGLYLVESAQDLGPVEQLLATSFRLVDRHREHRDLRNLVREEYRDAVPEHLSVTLHVFRPKAAPR